MDKYLDNRSKMDNFKNQFIDKKTEKERIIEEILKKHEFWFVFKKGFLRLADDFCVVDFYLPRPYRAAIQILEDKDMKLDKEMLIKRKFHLLTLNTDDFDDLKSLEDKLRVFLSNSKFRNKTPKQRRQVIAR